MKLKNILLLGVILVITFSKSQAQTDLNSAQSVFIYNFLSHIKWPDSAIKDKYVIGVYGKTKTLQHLQDYTKHRRVGNKTIQVISMNNAQDATKCNLVFVAENKESEVRKIDEVTRNSSCLIISENFDSIKDGAVVAFQHRGVKLSYRLDQENAKAQNLIVSTALISMSL